VQNDRYILEVITRSPEENSHPVSGTRLFIPEATNAETESFGIVELDIVAAHFRRVEIEPTARRTGVIAYTRLPPATEEANTQEVAANDDVAASRQT
jgi:hypothetical protein